MSIKGERFRHVNVDDQSEDSDLRLGVTRCDILSKDGQPGLKHS